MESVASNAFRFVAVDLMADFFLFPVWWYTSGLVRAIRTAGSWINYARSLMAVGLWAKNIFVPMFAQYDLAGRLISFFVRLGMIILRSIGLVIFLLLTAVLLLLYLAFPIFLGWLVWRELVGLLFI